jgi:anti-sigma factor RsiW
MKPHNPELISALVDGELRGLRRWLVHRHVGECALCAAEYRRLVHVRQLLATNPVTPVMSDSPEFFWSKIRRDIEAQAGQTAQVPTPHLTWSDWLFRHQTSLVGATAAVVAVIGLTVAVRTYRPAGGDLAQPIRPQGPAATVAQLTTTLPDTVATAFDEADEEVTVIWVSGLPWTQNLTEMHTLFATIDS